MISQKKNIFKKFYELNPSFEVSKHFIDLFKAGKGVGIGLDDLHHFADLSFVDNTNQHIFIGVRKHAVHLDLRDAMPQAGHQFLG